MKSTKTQLSFLIHEFEEAKHTIQEMQTAGNATERPNVSLKRTIKANLEKAEALFSEKCLQLDRVEAEKEKLSQDHLTLKRKISLITYKLTGIGMRASTGSPETKTY